MIECAAQQLESLCDTHNGWRRLFRVLQTSPDPENVSGEEYFNSDEETLVATGAEPVFSDEMKAELELDIGEIPNLEDLGAALTRGIPLH